MEDGRSVPLMGLATAIFDARADRENISPDSLARNNKANRGLGLWSGCEQFLLKDNMILLGGWRAE
jgi:hypothetical protein